MKLGAGDAGMDTGSGRVGHLEQLRQHYEGHPGGAWREQMERYDVTQAQMARQTGASQKHINQILQGNVLPSADLVVKMALVLHDGDPSAARNKAILLWGLQGRYLLLAAFLELKTWHPQPDLPHRGRGRPVTPKEKEER